MWERLPYGPDAWLIRHSARIGDAAFERGRAIAAHLEATAPPGVTWAAGFTSVLLELGPDAPPLQTLVAALEAAPVPPPGPLRTVPVVYDGEDLPALAAACGLAPAEAASLHAAPEYRVYALGFSPGFPYLGDLDPRLHAPRRATPREHVRAGSVAIGGEHTGIYPLDGPGGWNLIGRTSLRLVDVALDGEDAFALRQGDRVRFAPVDRIDSLPPRSASGSLIDAVSPAPLPPEPAAEPAVEVLSRAVFASLRDGGRPARWRRFGVPSGGAMDPVAAARANAAVGNPPDAPVIEVLSGRLALVPRRTVRLGFAGSSGHGHAIPADAGVRVELPSSPDGLWSYVAIEGGFRGALRFGSVAPGPRGAWGTQVTAGTTLARGDARGSRLVPSAGEGAVRVHPGPEWARFTSSARALFLGSDWKVTTASDRAGYRLAGPALPVPEGEAISEPTRTGTVQVPPDGQPIVTMPDGPTVGGYAKLAWVEPVDLGRVAQTRPGRLVRFRLAEEAGP